MYLKTGLKFKKCTCCNKNMMTMLMVPLGSSKHLVESLKECCHCSTCSSVELVRLKGNTLWFVLWSYWLITNKTRGAFMNTVYKLTGYSLKGDCIHFTNIFLQFTKLYFFNDVILCFKGLTEKQMIKSNISKDCSWSSCVKSWLTDQGRSKASYTQILNLWMQTPVIIPICALGVSELPHSYRLFQ